MTEHYKARTAGKKFRGIIINQSNPYVLTENFLRLSLQKEHAYNHGALVTVQYDESAELTNING